MNNFSISDNKGFQIKFDNDVIVSVQFGPFNYCKNYPNNKCDLAKANEPQFSDDAEIAIFKPGHQWLTKKWKPDAGDDVIGWVGPNDVLDALNWAKNYKDTNTL